MNYKNKYIGNEDQLMTVQESVLCQGRQKGVKMIHVENGGNLSVTILPDRGMDIYQIRYKGKNLNYIGPCGIVAPEYYDARDCEWLKGFYCGFLTTIGLQHFGDPRGDNGLHGRAAYAPAENVEIVRGIEKGKPTVTVKGTMREAQLGGPNLRLTRTIKFFYEEDKIEMSDAIENYGFTKQQYVLGYHINYGWPLLSEDTKIDVQNSSYKGRTDYAAGFIKETNKVQSPAADFPERCYIYDMKGDAKGNTSYTIKNDKAKLAVKASFNTASFPKLCQWQFFTAGQYVMGLEPLVCELDVPLVGEKNSPAPALNPGQVKEHKIKFEFC